MALDLALISRLLDFKDTILYFMMYVANAKSLKL